jgi:uncharacterized protein YlxW (UPF0749 family)
MSTDERPDAPARPEPGADEPTVGYGVPAGSGEGADRRPEDSPTDGRARLKEAMGRPASRGQVIAAGLLAVLGFAAVVQVQSNSNDEAYVGARQDELVELINSLSLASERTENEIADLLETRDSLRSDTESRRTLLEEARQLATELGILGGTVPAVGNGIRVTVDDPTGGVGSNHLINGIQELRDAGAEVIELNDTVRVVAQTALRDSPSGGVSVDGEQIAAPYVIEAIGSPHDLEVALGFRRGFTDEVEDVGGEVRIEQLDKVEVSSVREPFTPDFAEPAPTQ